MPATGRKIVSIILTTLLLLTATLAEERLSSSRLRSLGVDASSLQPITFSHDDRMLAAFDRASFEEKKQGTFYRLWLFPIGRDGTFGQPRSVPLPLKNLQQGEFTPDDKQFVLVGNRGTTFLSVDLRDYSLKTLLEPEWGKSGFRADPAVLWTEGGRMFVSGFPYDEHRFIEPRTVATLRPNAPPAQRFQRGANLSALEKGLERLWFSNYVTDRSAFYGQQYPGVTLLSFWDGDAVREFDRAWKFIGFWGNAGRLLYSARRGQGQPSELTLYDTRTGSKKLLASDEEDYRYLFLSRDGKTALTSQMSEPDRRLTAWYAREADGWKLKPAVTDSRGEPRTLPSGWMRLASSGAYLAHVGETGLALYPLR